MPGLGKSGTSPGVSLHILGVWITLPHWTLDLLLDSRFIVGRAGIATSCFSHRVNGSDLLIQSGAQLHNINFWTILCKPLAILFPLFLNRHLQYLHATMGKLVTIVSAIFLATGGESASEKLLVKTHTKQS